MAKILNFPARAAHGTGMERYLTPRECLILGLADPFADWMDILDDWFAAHPQARTQRNNALRAQLADTWLIFHLACDESSRLVMQTHHRLRWAQLEYDALSDVELLMIVSDNLNALRRGLAELCQQHPPQVRSDLNLFGLTQGVQRLNRQLTYLLDPDASASRQPEWTS